MFVDFSSLVLNRLDLLANWVPNKPLGPNVSLNSKLFSSITLPIQIIGVIVTGIGVSQLVLVCSYLTCAALGGKAFSYHDVIFYLCVLVFLIVLVFKKANPKEDFSFTWPTPVKKPFSLLCLPGTSSLLHPPFLQVDQTIAGYARCPSVTMAVTSPASLTIGRKQAW